MAAVVCIGIPLGYELAGVEGALVALTLAPCAAAPVALMRSGREVGADFRREIAMMILVPVACGLFVAL